MPRVRVIGFGNPAAGDDAAGLIAAAWAREELRGEPSVEVVEASAGTRALDLMEGADAVVVVEAVHAPDGQRQPGRLVRAVAGQDGLVEHAGPTVSSSQSIPTQTIGLAATLGTGRRVVFVGVEVADVSAGRPLSAPVAAGLSSLVGMIVVEVEKLIAAQDARERPPDPRLPAGHETPARTPSLDGRS